MDIKEYEEFCKNSKYGNFMQSADWARVKKGWIPEYVAVRDENGKINGCTLVLVKKIPILNTAMLYAEALYATLTTVKPSEKYSSR